MKKTFIYSLSALAGISLCLAGYRLFGPMKITGKVFIVKGNSEVVRLPLVNLYIVDADQAKLSRVNLEKSAESLKNEYSELDKEIKAIDGQKERAIFSRYIESLKKSSNRIREIEQKRSVAQLTTKQLEKDNKELLEIIAKIETDISSLSTVSQFEDSRIKSVIKKYADECDLKSLVNFLNHDVILGYERGLNSLKEQLKSPLIQKQISLYKDYKALFSPDNLGKLPDKIAASTISDDNGEFAISVPRGEYYVFASSSRKVVSETEFYYWASPVKAEVGNPDPLILSNQNLIEEIGSNYGNLWQFLNTRPLPKVDER